MNRIYFGLGPSIAWMQRRYPPIQVQNLTVDEFKLRISQGVEAILHSGHRPLMMALKSRFGIDVPIPSQPAEVNLQIGDTYLAVYVGGLRQLDDSQSDYTQGEVERAGFQFTEFRFEAPQRLETVIDDLQNEVGGIFANLDRQAEEMENELRQLLGQ